jgi:hypothetical protein
METLSIGILQRQIKVSVEENTVYYYKEAEKMINQTVLSFAKQWNYTDHQDLLSKVLLEYVVRWIENKDRLEEYDNQLIPMMEQLNTLADGLKVGK